VSRLRASGAGFTLVEALTAMVILLLIIGGIFAFEISAGRLSARATRLYRAEGNAQDGMKAMVAEMEAGIKVLSAASGSAVKFTLPQTASGSNLYTIPITAGSVIKYYLSDATGTAAGGTYLWRAAGNVGSEPQPDRILTRNVISLNFQPRLTRLLDTDGDGAVDVDSNGDGNITSADADMDGDGIPDYDTVIITLTARAESGSKVNTQTHSATVKLRNFGTG